MTVGHPPMLTGTSSTRGIGVNSKNKCTCFRTVRELVTILHYFLKNCSSAALI